MKRKVLLALCFAAGAATAAAQTPLIPKPQSGNPLFEGWYADPEGAVFGDEYWIYPTYSAAFDDQTFMDAFSSKDLVHWQKHPRIISTDEGVGERPVAPQGSYCNPVVNYSLPDPTALRADDGYYYLYATEDIPNVPILRSKNLVDWEFIGTAFSDTTRPTFEPKGHVWAPCVSRIGGRYVMHYSMSVWAGEWTCGIGVAVADRPEGPFDDLGPLFRSNEIGVQNSIDPCYFEQDGKKYLVWGSFHGIFAVELTDDGLDIAPGAERVQLAGTAYEGTDIHKHGGYYYLFASTGSCCDGLRSTYTTVVGRSKHPQGPYVDRRGRPMLENHHEVLIHGNPDFAGTGHSSHLVTDDKGQDWILYHAYSRANPKGRVLMLDRVRWEKGWPVVAHAEPSACAAVPAIKR